MCAPASSRRPAWTGPKVLAIDNVNLRAWLAAEILTSSSYQSTMDKVRVRAARGSCRATFFNYRRRLGNGPHSSSIGLEPKKAASRTPMRMLSQEPPQVADGAVV